MRRLGSVLETLEVSWARLRFVLGHFGAALAVFEASLFFVFANFASKTAPRRPKTPPRVPENSAPNALRHPVSTWGSFLAVLRPIFGPFWG